MEAFSSFFKRVNMLICACAKSVNEVAVMIIKLLIVCFLTFSTKVYADDRIFDARVSSGFLIIDMEKGDEIKGIRNLVVKLDDIESITHFSDIKSSKTHQVVIKLNKKHEHFESQKQYVLEFAHPTPSDTIYDAIIEALANAV
jgi:hypothetical protein